MYYSLEIRPLAALEIIEAYDWYESQKEGLENEFLQELESFHSNLLQNPLSHSYYDKPVRQGKLARFPYNVVYEVIEFKIVVYSVFMNKQDPNKKRTG